MATPLQAEPDIAYFLAEFRGEIDRLTEPVIPGVRAEIRRAAETLVTDVEHLIPV